LEQRIAALGASGYIWMAGSRKDIPAVMNAMDVMAQNSLVEPLGMSLMEGFACCKTAAATGVDGVLEVVDNGRTGLLSAPEDAAELVENIRLLVSDAARRERLGSAARQRMIDCFSPALQTAKMRALYDRILRSKPAVRRHTEAGAA
jgi:glycosyltransferase involved in cell wall biosynthesis